jgi:hypothetical protein
MGKQLTAVEWLMDEWLHLDAEFDMVLIDRNTYWEKLKEIQCQAKEMEEEQKIEFACQVAEASAMKYIQGKTTMQIAEELIKQQKQ